MKIKCESHGRRVMMIRNKNVPIEVILHRDDGTKCDSVYLVQGEKTIHYVPFDDDSILLTREN